MAHGIYFSSRFKDNDIVTFHSMFKKPKGQFADFTANYEYIIDIFKHVASENGIVIPNRFLSFEAKSPRNRYGTHKSNCCIMEPLGKIIHVDQGYSLNGILQTDLSRGAALADYNWYKMAENFLMVNGSASKALALANSSRFRPGIMCEKFRVRKFRKLTNKE